MPYYGGPDLGIEYTFIAVQPFDAEHPIGSGQVVTFKPGEPFPGEDWGNAASNLVEMGKAVRLAVNVTPAPSGGGALVAPEESEYEAESFDPSADFPVRGGGGWFTLSDGTRIRGEEAAYEAQKNLDIEGGAE